MSKKIRFFIILLIILIALGVLFLIKIFISKSNEFNLNNDRYIVTTDTWIWSESDDGGSYYNDYYEIDLLKKVIEEREDYNCNSVSLSKKEQREKSYKRKLLESGTLTEEQAKQLKELLDNRINEGSAEQNMVGYWKITSKSKEDIIMSNEEKEEFLKIIETSINE